MASTATSTSTTTSMEVAPNKDGSSFLLCGGTGFIGRNLVEYLCKNKLASEIVIADKSMPATSYLNPLHKELYKSDVVTFKQNDLAKDDHVERLFKDRKFDYIINLCGETRFGLTEHDYNVRCEVPAVKVSKKAQEVGCKKYIELSTGQVYAPTKDASKEDDKLEPWTMQAKYRLLAEEAVKKVEGLPWVILRPSICYGIGDRTGLSPRITCAAVYQKTQKKLKFLWTKQLSMNVVHVRDVCEAIWVACTELEAGSIYNLSDPDDVTQGDLNDVMGELFGVETSFHGNAVSTMAKINLSAAADMANDMHVPEWTRMCQAAGIMNTPLTPYIDKELLYCNHLKLDGTKITKDSKFTYKEKFCKETVKEQIDAFVSQKIFPPVKLS